MATVLYTRVLLLIVCVSKVLTDERHCSRFSYEKSTLEKMIRMEINVEGMEKLIKKYADQIEATEERTKNVLDKLEAKSGEIDKILEEKSGEIDNILQEKERQIERMSRDLVEFRNKTMDDLKDLAVTPLVAFRANGIADTSPANAQTLVFPTTVLNEGQGYDNATGQFTAPTDGLYHLSVQLCFITKKYMLFDIVVDNVVVNAGYWYDANSYQCSSADTSVVMKRNMKAWVKCAYGYSSKADFMVEGRHYMNIFSGFLVHEKQSVA